MTAPLRVRFSGGDDGLWSVRSLAAVKGPPLPAVRRLAVHESVAGEPSGPAVWVLEGTTSHVRYASRSEAATLKTRSPALGRPEATRAALVPIRKAEAWWDLAQDERRAIFEDRSRHIADTLRFLPAIARRLHHARDLGQPFDFLTWFEWAPEHDAAFDELVGLLRRSEEWQYVEHEVEVRLER